MSRQIVKSDIPWGGVLAYTRGQYIESELVEEHGWQDFVVGENTKEGRELKADVSGQPIESFETPKDSSSSSRSSRAAATTEKQEG